MRRKHSLFHLNSAAQIPSLTPSPTTLHLDIVQWVHDYWLKGGTPSITGKQWLYPRGYSLSVSMLLLGALFHYVFIHPTEPSRMMVAEIQWVHAVLQFLEVSVDGVFGDVEFVVLCIR